MTCRPRRRRPSSSPRASGATMDADTLAVVFGRDPDVALRAALEKICCCRWTDAYRFPHDRVQEAAYSLIPEAERATMHLRIGRLLLRAARRPTTLEEKIFDVVNQLNLGAALVTSREERDRIAELNLMAGRRAQRVHRLRLRAQVLRGRAPRSSARIAGRDATTSRSRSSSIARSASCDTRRRHGGAAARRAGRPGGER